ncbi:MAG: hypothetical protein KGL39_56300 [Patescibacteria group bacterium]|nr:hypothetical protein [Patescibacteria group bacterium]
MAADTGICRCRHTIVGAQQGEVVSLRSWYQVEPVTPVVQSSPSTLPA